MYGWLWRKLPGHWSVKLLESLVMIGVICAFLIIVVFPWVEPKLPFSDNTVDGGPGVSGPATTPPGAPTATNPAPGPTDTTLPGDTVIPGDE